VTARYSYCVRFINVLSEDNSTPEVYCDNDLQLTREVLREKVELQLRGHHVDQFEIKTPSSRFVMLEVTYRYSPEV
jgi:hypothetical protein